MVYTESFIICEKNSTLYPIHHRLVCWPIRDYWAPTDLTVSVQLLKGGAALLEVKYQLRETLIMSYCVAEQAMKWDLLRTAS